MLLMIIERFRNRIPSPSIATVRDLGRQLPARLKHVDSWAEPSFDRCFQLMGCLGQGAIVPPGGGSFSRSQKRESDLAASENSAKSTGLRT